MNYSENQSFSAPRRDQILSAVGYVASVFLKSANWKDALDSALARLGKATQANRAYYFENYIREDGCVMTNQVAEWAAPGIEPQIDNPACQNVNFVEAGMGRWVEVMSQRKPVYGLIADFPKSERSILEAQDIRSLIAMPVFSQNQFVGFLGFDDCENQREWASSEIDALFTAATALGAAIDRQHLENQLRFAQKMEAVGSLASGVAHDFNNMLQAIVGLTNIVKLRIGADHEAQKELEQIISASDRASSLTQQLLIFSRKQEYKPEIADLGEICESVVTMVKPILGGSIEVSVDVEQPAPTIYADAGLFSQVLLNVCLNARDSMPKGGKLEIECTTVELGLSDLGGEPDVDPGQFVCVSLSDTGVGMASEVKDRIFEPFFTTKEPGQGTGLGLSVAYGTVRQCGGFIKVESCPNQGTQFQVFVPTSAKPDPKSKRRFEVMSGDETILLVDDEPMVLKSIQRLLEAFGYTVLTARDGLEGLQTYKENAEHIELLVTDSVMPGMDGGTLIESILELNADAKAILVSGYVANLPESLQDNQHFLVLKKPVPTDVLNQAIRDLLD